MNYDTLYDYVCITENQYSVSDKLTTSTVTCHNPILFQTGFILSAATIIIVAMFIYKKVC